MVVKHFFLLPPKGSGLGGRNEFSFGEPRGKSPPGDLATVSFQFFIKIFPYESSIFSEQDKRDYHAKYGKEMEEKACQLGRQLIQDAQKDHSR